MNRTDKSRPAEIVLVANEKGGVGKSTTVLTLSACLQALGYSVMICDLDPSANLSMAVLPNVPKLSLYDVFDEPEKYSLIDILVETPFGYVAPSVKNLPDLDGDLIVTNTKSLTKIATRLLGERGGEYRLDRLLRKDSRYDLHQHFDFILLDSAPSDNILITNAIVAADSVLVPIEPSMASMDGLQMFLGSISTAQEFYKTNVAFDGMLQVKYTEDSSSERNANATVELACQRYEIPRYNTKIRYSKTMRAAMDSGRPILEYMHNGHGGPDSMNMTLEFLRRRGLQPRKLYPGVTQNDKGDWYYSKPSKKED